MLLFTIHNAKYPIRSKPFVIELSPASSPRKTSCTAVLRRTSCPICDGTSYWVHGLNVWRPQLPFPAPDLSHKRSISAAGFTEPVAEGHSTLSPCGLFNWRPIHLNLLLHTRSAGPPHVSGTDQHENSWKISWAKSKGKRQKQGKERSLRETFNLTRIHKTCIDVNCGERITQTTKVKTCFHKWTSGQKFLLFVCCFALAQMVVKTF